MGKGHFLRWTACGLVCLVLLASCAGKDDADVIRNLVRQGARLAEEHDVDGLMKLTSDEFFALPGRHDRAAVKGILRMGFGHYRQFKILYPEPGVDFTSEGAEALATIHFLIVRKERTYPGLDRLYKDPQGWLEEVGENADLYRLTLDLAKTEGPWRVKQAHLEPYRGLHFGER